MYISKFLLLSLISMISISLINSHGYAIYPMARQQKCPKGNIWWPEDGSGITDAACRSAFQFVKAKGNNPQYQFIQSNEFSVLIPNYAQGASALKAAVPNSLCSAYATTSSNDKSGMSIVAPWTPTIIPTTANAVNVSFTYKFCATASHNPNFWEFYVSKPGFNPTTTPLTWDHLTLFQSFPNTASVSISDPSCSSTSAYIFNLNMPTRFSNAILLVRWQRVDPVGECFINCSDFKCVA
ncbi:hypothetical protein DDB_G0273103 [Dictyostelium discoideum AX4]|uniref:Chitin-binding type-4 domain-containing protein n=1 Tax=Dictyostelium discoideum TaxID=44689 RepID=Q556T5_DICDI|nr:hypothetical protein DDB_G0273835 [Dictyostelium discoideum AX4]XP_644716.1 hypothetical protein DDB_G0273103 [Dictyostelium discoideum AX4]EAL70608.1 hypothetical protein DDB_G0273835 [Dictyostelium discoideum AX4]EAL70769.1 hypothetical protein DDB_G0273103 [Dictyostelium discoideum AX4]|eukprot:XP_644534.1 hypothetical protein DDB_G0273835 [Dictyostelium discoideum AX4]